MVFYGDCGMGRASFANRLIELRRTTDPSTRLITIKVSIIK